MRRAVSVLLAAAVTVSVAACGILGGESGLTGKTWQWQASTTASPAGQTAVPNPLKYTITFDENGTYAGKADCNQIAGSYEASESSLAISAGPSTLVACGPDSLDQQFMAGILSSTTFKVDGSTLTLTNAAGDTMQFSAG
jgi:heat shock protein HslJ